MPEVHAVEVRFPAEKLATSAADGVTYTLYRRPEGGYFVHYDEGEAGAYLVTGLSAALRGGHLREGIGVARLRRHWPELATAAGLD